MTATGAQYVYWRGAHGHIDMAWHSGSWSRPRDLTRFLRWGAPGTSTSAIGVAAAPGGEGQYLVWRDRAGQIVTATYDGRWQSPLTTSWRTASAPSVAVTAAGRQYVYWEAQGAIWVAWDDGGWTGPLRRWRLNPGRDPYVEVVQTSSDLAQRLAPLSNIQFGSVAAPGLPTIAVDDAVRYQQVMGFGAAMTDSSAWLIGDVLPAAVREALMKLLFGSDGIRLDFTLVPIGASDFSAGRQPYTYDDLPSGQTDPALNGFSISHDEAYVLPVLRQMLAINPQIATLAVPWSPPAWMKANGRLDDLNYSGTLLPGAYQPLAGYFVKFLAAYAAAGVPISAIAPENEPLAESPFPAMSFPEPSEAQWVAEDLRPALAAAGLAPRIYGADNGWEGLEYAQALITSQARASLSGIAWHCYNGVPDVMSTLHATDPTAEQIVTECAPNLTSFPIPEVLIGAMRNWASAVTLWNLALDPAGGPVQPPNFGCGGCAGIVTIDEATQAPTFNLDYYQLGQISAFVTPGAVRISSTSAVTYGPVGPGTYGAGPGLDDVAFVNPDGTRVLLAYNNTAAPIQFAVQWDGRAFTYTLPAAATVTLRWNPQP